MQTALTATIAADEIGGFPIDCSMNENEYWCTVQAVFASISAMFCFGTVMICVLNITMIGQMNSSDLYEKLRTLIILFETVPVLGCIIGISSLILTLFFRTMAQDDGFGPSSLTFFILGILMTVAVLLFWFYLERFATEMSIKSAATWLEGDDKMSDDTVE